MDIHNKEFKSKGRNGYDRYEVDSFLDEIVDNYGDALDQIVDLKNEVVSLNSKIKDLQAQVDEYNDKKKSINKSLISAQQNADEMKERAEAEARRIVEDAKKNANRIINEALLRAEKTEDEAATLKRNINIYKRRLKAIIEQQLDMVNDIEKVDF